MKPHQLNRDFLQQNPTEKLWKIIMQLKKKIFKTNCCKYCRKGAIFHYTKARQYFVTNLISDPNCLHLRPVLVRYLIVGTIYDPFGKSKEVFHQMMLHIQKQSESDIHLSKGRVFSFLLGHKLHSMYVSKIVTIFLNVALEFRQ